METFLNLSAVRGFFPSCQGTWRPPWACQTFGFHAILQYLTFSFCAPRRRGKCSQMTSYMCHIHNYTEYNQHWNVFSAFNPSKCTHTWSSGQPTLRRPGSVGGSVLKGLISVVDNSCRSQDSNPQPRVTSPMLYPLEPRLPSMCSRF